MSEHPTPGRDKLAEALKALVPSPANLDRDRLMFQAGGAALRGRCRRWQWGAGLMTATSLCLALTVAARPEAEPVIRIVHVPVRQSATPPRPPANPPRPAVVGEPPAQFALGPNGPSQGRLQQALLQVGLDVGAPPAGGMDESGDTASPVGRHGPSAWEWHNEVSRHPSILDQESE